MTIHPNDLIVKFGQRQVPGEWGQIYSVYEFYSESGSMMFSIYGGMAATIAEIVMQSLESGKPLPSPSDFFTNRNEMLYKEGK